MNLLFQDYMQNIHGKEIDLLRTTVKVPGKRLPRAATTTVASSASPKTNGLGKERSSVGGGVHFPGGSSKRRLSFFGGWEVVSMTKCMSVASGGGSGGPVGLRAAARRGGQIWVPSHSGPAWLAPLLLAGQPLPCRSSKNSTPELTSSPNGM